MRTAHQLMIAGWAILGCSDPDLGDAEIEIGTGTIAFEPLADGDALEVIAGPQGGYHFIVHARARGIERGDARTPGAPQNPITAFGAELDGEPIELQLPPYQLGYVDADDGWAALPSGRILQIDNDVAVAIDGREVTITVSVTDRHGDRAEDRRAIRAVGPIGQ